jgi:CelD/BcsL family acetyltransferase involved in cellulose biosynthesis
VRDGRMLRFLGSGKACSEYQSLLVDDKDVQCVCETLTDWLVQAIDHTDDAWDQLDLTAIADGDRAIASLASCLSDRGAQITARPSMGCWRLELKSTWEAQLELIGSNLRRKLCKLERTHLKSGIAVHRVATSRESVLQHFDQLVDLHQRRWRQAGVDGCFSNPSFTEFLRRAALAFFESQQLWMTAVDVHGQSAAAAMFLRANDELFLYQCGMNLELRSHQPGWLMNLLSLRAAIDNSIRAVDYLRGNERYKQELGARIVPQSDWRIAAPQTLSRLRHQIWRTQGWLRDLGKQLVTSRR